MNLLSNKIYHILLLLMVSGFFAGTPESAVASEGDELCASVKGIFQQLTLKLKGQDLYHGYINNAKAVVKNENMRVVVQLQCPQMSKGIETIAKKTPAFGSPLWKQSVLQILGS